MRRRLLAAILWMLMTPSLAIAQEPDCPQFFINGQPPVLINPDNRQRTMLPCNDDYASLASGLTHGQVWSAEHPTAASLEAAGQIRRENEFHPEDRLPSDDQAQLGDYRHSGFDRGRMTPSGDMPDARVQAQSFSLANVVPQVAQLNRGAWEGVESAVRHLAEQEGELYVVTGPAFVGDGVSAIGPDHVLVPTSIWKAIYDPRVNGTGVTSAGTPKRRRAGRSL